MIFSPNTKKGWYICHGCQKKITNWIVEQRGLLWHPYCAEFDVARRLEPGELERITRDDGCDNIPQISTYSRQTKINKGKAHRTKYAEPI